MILRVATKMAPRRRPDFPELVRIGCRPLVIGLALLLFNGCGRQDEPRAPVEGAYGAPQREPAALVERPRPFDRGALEQLRQAPAYMIQSELTPAVLFHTSGNYLGFFTGMPARGLGAPAYAAISTYEGPQIAASGQVLQPELMREPWVLVWFSGAEGWTDWDSPWVVFLSRKPELIRLNEDGLHVFHRGAAGAAVLLPLYGYYKPPVEGGRIAGTGPAREVETWKWGEFLLREVLQRLRYWAGVTREFPLYCRESFSVDRSRDAVILRQEFEWLPIEDEWRTKPFKFAPLSPPLGFAASEGGFPVRSRRRIVDLEAPTPAGPYAGVQRVDGTTMTFRVLQYINETETPDPANIQAHESVGAALELLRETARGFLAGAGKELDAVSAQWLAKALPHLDAETRAAASVFLRGFLNAELQGGSGGRPIVLSLESLWAYAHFTDDWGFVSGNWPLIRTAFAELTMMRWAGFGRDEVSALGDQAGPALAMARLAYRAGDIDSYNYAAYLFARELVHHYFRSRGAEFIRKNQPWHWPETLPDTLFISELERDVSGWRIEAGPAIAGRWMRFNNEGVARFYRDHLRGDVRRELNALREMAPEEWRHYNAPAALPSLLQLRALLLDETAEQLQAVARTEEFSGTPAGILANCMMVIRSSRPVRYTRLIPGGPATPFVAGIERDIGGPHAVLTQEMEFMDEAGAPMWPLVKWGGEWRTPTGDAWNFGHVRLARDVEPADARAVPLSWNSRAVLFEFR